MAAEYVTRPDSGQAAEARRRRLDIATRHGREPKRFQAFRTLPVAKQKANAQCLMRFEPRSCEP